MNPGQSFLGGVAGAALSILLMGAARALGVPVHLERFLGTLAGASAAGVERWMTGLVLLLAAGGALGLLHAVALARMPERLHWAAGVGLGVLQGAAVFLAARRLDGLPWPEGDGDALAVIVVVQVAYGATVGLLHAATSPAASARALWDDAARPLGEQAAGPRDGGADATTHPAL